MNIVAFGDHLGTNQEIEFTFMQGAKDALEILTSAHGVTIKTSDSGLWEHSVQQLFQLFGASTKEIHVLAAAVNTMLRDGRGVSAVVAFHLASALVMGERDSAVLALEGLATSAAQNDG